MDKIDINSYLSDYSKSSHTADTVDNWWTTDYLMLRAPSPQLINFLFVHGWRLASPLEINISGAVLSLSDPTTINDYAVMKTQQLKATTILQDLVDDFTELYNEGIEINDDRYDEILSLWAACQDKTEDELNSLENDEDSFESLVEGIFTNISSDFTSYETDSNNRFDDWGDSLREIVDDDADALLSSKEANLRARGLYNSTLWDAVETGIERERTDADINAEDKILVRQQELDDRLYQFRTQMRDRLIEARTRLMRTLHKQANTRIALRNKVVEAITAFAERREDDYPSFIEPMNAALEIAVSQTSQGWAQVEQDFG